MIRGWETPPALREPPPCKAEEFSCGRTSYGKQGIGLQRIANICNKYRLLLKKTQMLGRKTFFSPTDSLIASGVCINATGVYVSSSGVYTNDTAVYRNSRRRLYFSRTKTILYPFASVFLPHYGIRPLMSCARNAISKINEPLKPVLSPLNSPPPRRRGIQLPLTFHLNSYLPPKQNSSLTPVSQI